MIIYDGKTPTETAPGKNVTFVSKPTVLRNKIKCVWKNQLCNITLKPSSLSNAVPPQLALCQLMSRHFASFPLYPWAMSSGWVAPRPRTVPMISVIYYVTSNTYNEPQHMWRQCLILEPPIHFFYKLYQENVPLQVISPTRKSLLYHFTPFNITRFHS